MAGSPKISFEGEEQNDLESPSAGSEMSDLDSCRETTMKDRFWQKVKIEKENECWLWLAAKTAKGYGYFWVDSERKSVNAHRVSWEIKNGPVPEGMLVCHNCDTPACVNPEHLFLGTAKDNMDDMVSKDRTKSSLTRAQREDIRTAYKTGAYTQAQLAEEHNVARTTIGHVVNFKVFSDEQYEAAQQPSCAGSVGDTGSVDRDDDFNVVVYPPLDKGSEKLDKDEDKKSDVPWLYGS